MKKKGKKTCGEVKAKFSISSIYKKKSTKIISKKNMWGNTVSIHSVLKKKNYKTNFSTSSI
jgi:hypothetical protein